MPYGMTSFLLMAVVLGCSAPIVAQTSVYWEELTWMEIGDAIKTGKTTVLIPTGAIEDKGPQMAVGAHTVVARYTAGEIAKRLGNALVAPTVAYAPNGAIAPMPTGHMDMMGSLTVADDVYAQFLVWAARSFKHHGMKDIVLLFDSGVTRASVNIAADALRKEFAGAGTRVHVATAYYDSTQAYEEWLKEHGETVETIGRQAGITQTSEILALAPELVRKNKVAVGAPGTGATGDPRRASVAYGRQSLEMKIDAAVTQIKTMVTEK